MENEKKSILENAWTLNLNEKIELEKNKRKKLLLDFKEELSNKLKQNIDDDSVITDLDEVKYLIYKDGKIYFGITECIEYILGVDYSFNEMFISSWIDLVLFKESELEEKSIFIPGYCEGCHRYAGRLYEKQYILIFISYLDPVFCCYKDDSSILRLKVLNEFMDSKITLNNSIEREFKDNNGK